MSASTPQRPQSPRISQTSKTPQLALAAAPANLPHPSVVAVPPAGPVPMGVPARVAEPEAADRRGVREAAELRREQVPSGAGLRPTPIRLPIESPRSVLPRPAGMRFFVSAVVLVALGFVPMLIVLATTVLPF